MHYISETRDFDAVLGVDESDAIADFLGLARSVTGQAE